MKSIEIEKAHILATMPSADKVNMREAEDDALGYAERIVMKKLPAHLQEALVAGEQSENTRLMENSKGRAGMGFIPSSQHFIDLLYKTFKINNWIER